MSKFPSSNHINIYIYIYILVLLYIYLASYKLILFNLCPIKGINNSNPTVTIFKSHQITKALLS